MFVYKVLKSIENKSKKFSILSCYDKKYNMGHIKIVFINKRKHDKSIEYQYLFNNEVYCIDNKNNFNALTFSATCIKDGVPQTLLNDFFKYIEEVRKE